MTNQTSEPTLFDIAQQLVEIKQGQAEVKQQIEKLELRFGFLETRFDGIEKRFTNWDNRLADLSMRQMQVNSSAFFGVGIALLSAVIAFVVARISGGAGL